MKKRIVKIISLLLCIVLMLNCPLMNYNIQKAYAAFNNKIFKICEEGYFRATYNQSGAINVYMLKASLLSEKSVVRIIHDRKDSQDIFYWVNDSELAKDYENVTITESILVDMNTYGERYYFEVLSGSFEVYWPENQEDMPYDYYAGKDIENDKDEGDEDKSNYQIRRPTVSDMTLEELHKLGLDKLFSDGKILLFGHKMLSGQIESDEAKLFLADCIGNEFDLSDDGLPIHLSHTENEDGTITWRMKVPNDYEEDEPDLESDFVGDVYEYFDNKNWENYKKTVNELKCTSADFANLYKQYKEDEFPIVLSIGGKQIIGNETLGAPFMNADANVGGYVEFVTDSDYNLIKGTGELGGTIEAKSKTHVNQNLLHIGALPLPWYWTWQYDCFGTASLDLNLLNINNERKYLEKEGQIIAKSNVTGTAGVGLYGIINIEGETNLEMDVDIFPKSKVVLNGSVSANARFLKYYKKNLLGPLEYKNVLFEEINNDSIIELGDGLCKAALYANEFSSELEVVSRDSDENITSLSDEDIEALYSISGDGIDSNVLLDKSIEGSQPVVTSIDGKNILVYTAMLASGNEQDSGRIMYMVQEGDTWSKPRELWDNGCADYYYDVQTIGNELYIVWQKASSKVIGDTADAMLLDALMTSEICFAKFDKDSNSFIEQQYITENSKLDMLPKLVRNSEKVSVAWIENTLETFDCLESGSISVMTLEDGKWSEKKQLANYKGYLGEFVPFENNNLYNVVYSCNENDDANTSLYLSYGEQLVQVEENKSSILGLQYSDNNIYWLSDGIVKSLVCNSDFNNPSIIKWYSEYEANENKAVSANFKVISNGIKTSVVWGAQSDNGFRIYTRLLDKSRRKLGSTLEAFEKTDSGLISYDVILEENGDYEFVLDERLTGLNNQNIISEIHKHPVEGVCLSHVDMTDSNRVDSKQKLRLTVTNMGEKTIEKINIKIVSNGIEYVNASKDIKINAGVTKILNATFDLSNITKITQKKKFEVVVYVDGQEIGQKQCFETYLGKTDIAIEGNKTIADDTVTMKYKITNKSDTLANAKVNVTCNDELIECEEIEALNGKESELFMIKIHKSQLSFVNGYCDLCAEVIVDDEEYDLTNNKTSCFIAINEFVKGEPEESDKPEDNPIVEPEKPEDNPVVEPDKPIYKISLNKTSANINVGESLRLRATLSPDDRNSSLNWKSSDTNILKVDGKGNVNAIKPGRAIVSVYISDDIYASCSILVRKAPTKITLDRTSITANKGQSFVLSYKIPANSFTTVSYTSSNKKVAVVDDKGKITTKGIGKATIKVKTANGKSATCVVYVKLQPSKITLNKTSVNMKKDARLKLNYSIPKNTYSKVTFSSSNKAVATVSNSGVVKAKKIGKCTIICKTANGKKVTCKISVKK